MADFDLAIESVVEGLLRTKLPLWRGTAQVATRGGARPRRALLPHTERSTGEHIPTAKGALDTTMLMPRRTSNLIGEEELHSRCGLAWGACSELLVFGSRPPGGSR
jgi:hypothetical protein